MTDWNEVATRIQQALGAVEVRDYMKPEEVLALQQAQELCERMARISALPAKWRARDNDWRDPFVDNPETERGMDLADARCADELEAELAELR